MAVCQHQLDEEASHGRMRSVVCSHLTEEFVLL